MGWSEGDFRIAFAALIPREGDRVSVGADLQLKAMGVNHDVVGVACGFRSLSDPEGNVRVGEFGKSGEEDSGYEVQDLVEGVKESELRVVRELVGRGDAPQRDFPVVLHARAHGAWGSRAFRLSSASRSR